MKIIKRIDDTKLRKICIVNNYYTRGDNYDYCNMFDMADNNGENVDIDVIENIAYDIKAHSDTVDEIIDIASSILFYATYEYIEE